MGKNRTTHDQQMGVLMRSAANTAAQQEGPTKRKHWTEHDMLPITGRNARQRAALAARERGQHVALLGTAGTGKTFLGLAMAFLDMFDPDNGIDRVLIVRSAVQGRDQGFIPGTLAEKMDPYSAPYRETLDELFPRFSRNYENMLEAGKVVFESTSFLRGRNLNRVAVLADEIQNYSAGEIRTLLTRGAPRVYLTGDTAQIDLDQRAEVSGVHHLRRCIPHMPSITAIEFEQADIIRKGLTREFILAEEAVARIAQAQATGHNPIGQPQPVARAA